MGTSPFEVKCLGKLNQGTSLTFYYVFAPESRLPSEVTSICLSEGPDTTDKNFVCLRDSAVEVCFSSIFFLINLDSLPKTLEICMGYGTECLMGNHSIQGQFMGFLPKTLTKLSISGVLEAFSPNVSVFLDSIFFFYDMSRRKIRISRQTCVS